MPKPPNKRLTFPKRTLAVLEKAKDYKFNNRTTPNSNQMKFVEVFLKTGNARKAYEATGYYDLNRYTNEAFKYKSIQRVVYGKAVQFLLALVFSDWARRNEITAARLGEMTLRAYDNATSIREQLEAIKLLANLAGYQSPIVYSPDNQGR